MKLTCQITEDLLPLYEDGVCSPESRQAVEAHLKTCQACAAKRDRTQALALSVPELPLSEKKAVKGFRKLRRRWALSLAAVLVLLPLLAGLIWLGANQARGEGLCYTNLDEAARAVRFAKQLAGGDYGALTAHLDALEDYESIQQALSETWEDNMPRRTVITLDGQDYAVAAELLKWQDDPHTLWAELILNPQYHWAVLIPEDVLSAAAAQHPGQICFDGQAWYIPEKDSFLPLELEWGTFYVPENRWLDLYKLRDDPVLLCYTLELMPAALYTETLPALEADAKATWESSQAWNAQWKDMTLEEYTAQQAQEFVEAMERLEKQLTIQYKGIRDAYQIEGRWSIVVELSVTTGGKAEQLWLDLREWDSQIHIVGTSMKPENRGTVLEDLANVLLGDF